MVRRTAESLHDACVLHVVADATGTGLTALHDPHPEDGERRAAALASVVEAEVEAEEAPGEAEEAPGEAPGEAGPERALPPVLSTPRRVWLPEPDVGEIEALLGPRCRAYVNEMGVTSRLRLADSTSVCKTTSDPEDTPDALGMANISVAA